MRELFGALLISVALGCASLPTGAQAVKYLDTVNGTNPTAGCAGGDTRETAYQALQKLYERGCYDDATVIEIVGTAVDNSNRSFWNGENPRFLMQRPDDKPLTIRGDTTLAPVTWNTLAGPRSCSATLLTGYWGVTKAKNLRFENLSFTKPLISDRRNTLTNGGQNITYDSICVTGGAGAWVDGSAANVSDCMNIGVSSRNVRVNNSTFHDCPSDAVDIVGAIGPIYFTNNHVTQAYHAQRKGGAGWEGGVLDANNYYGYMTYGPTSGGMSCESHLGFCGNPALETLPVDERCHVYDYVFSGNTVERISKSRAMSPTGYCRATYKNNTFIEASGYGSEKAAWTLLHDTYDAATIAYFDPIALDFCADPANAARCVPCVSGGRAAGQACVKIKHPMRDVVIKNNVLNTCTNKYTKITGLAALGGDLDNLRFYDNEFRPCATSTRPMQWEYNKTTYGDFASTPFTKTQTGHESDEGDAIAPVNQ